MIPQAGERLGPYEILGELGGGGMAKVLRAWDGRLHREVAIKLIHDRYAMPGIRERFLREARAASGLNHPNICTIFDIGEQDGEPYLVMELLEGETLKDRIAEGAMPVDAIVRYGTEIAEALALAHSRGIVHRDIKPANIFLVKKANGQAQAKVLDFGLAKVGLYESKSGLSEELTTVGAAVGTVSYMSPEQARGEALDARSDLFSLGVVLYEMASGQLPFKGSTSALVFVQLLGQAPPEPVRDWNAAIPKELEAVIFKLLAKKPKARYQTADEVCRALGEVTEKKAGWLARSAALLMAPAAPKANANRAATLKDESEEIAAERPEAVKEPAREQPKEPPKESPAAAEHGGDILRPKTMMPETRRAKPVWEQQPTSSLGNGVVLARPGDPQAGRYRPRKESDDRRAGENAGGSSSQMRARPEAEAKPASSSEGRPTPSGERAAEAQKTETQKSDGQMRAQMAERLEAERKRLMIESGRRKAKSSAAAAAAADAAQGARTASGSSASESSNTPSMSPESKAAAGDGRIEQTAAATSVGSGRRRWLYLALAGLLLASALGWAYLRRHRAGVVRTNDVLLLTRVKNTTGDTRLNMALLEGLEIDLEQSRTLHVRGAAAYEAALGLVRPKAAAGPDDSMPDRIRLAAEKLGANEYLVGEIHGSDDFGAAPYAITVDLMSVATNERLLRIEDTAESKDRFAGAIDRVADQVRSAMGESGDSIAGSNIALKNEATASIDALSAYLQGEQAVIDGQRHSALNFFEKAVGFDSRFIQGQLKLATLDRDEFSELKSAQAARLALAASDSASERWKLRAQFRSALDVDGDYDAALKLMQQYVAEHPDDAEGHQALAQVLRLEGRFTEALQAAQQAYALDPFDVEGYAQAERALMSLDKFDAMENLEGLMQRWGIPPGDDALLGEYMGGRSGQLANAIALAKASPDDDALALRYAVYLDNTGQLKAGETVWSRAKETVAGPAKTTSADTASMVNETLAALNPDLAPETAKPSFLAQGALNRALVGDCADAEVLMRAAAQEAHGPRAEFNLGMTAGLCGLTNAASESLAALTKLLPGNTAAREYYVPDLKALIALKAGDAAGALSNLQGSQQYDLVSLTPYLRGLAHLAVNQPALAMADFQLVVSHRGAAAAGHSTVYPMSQIGLARALAATGDAGGSAAAYYRFIELWKDADAGQALVAEARAKTR